MCSSSILPSAALNLSLDGAVWFKVGDALLLDRLRCALLAQIDASGSITRAAKALGTSYKSAWLAIDAMNAAAGQAVVARITGGRGGGGTQLTATGRELVERFRIADREHQHFIARIGACAGASSADSTD